MIRLDFSNILTEEIGHNGLSLIEIENEAKKSISLLSEKPYKELDFIDLPFQDTSQIKELAKKQGIMSILLFLELVEVLLVQESCLKH